MKRMFAAAGAALLLAVGAAGGIAQEAVPTVEVSISATKMTVTGTDALKTGPTRLRFTAQGEGERGFIVFELKPGITQARIRREAPRIQSPADAHRFGRFVAGGFVLGGESYATTIELRDREYALIDFTRQPAVRSFFRAGAETSTAVPPTPVATISMRDYAFRGAATLPREGVVRVANDGRRLHHALLFRLRRGVNGRRVVRQIKRGGEPRRAFAGRPAALTELVSPGPVNDVETESRAGRHVLVCFVSNGRKSPPHAALGMVRLVNVE